VKRIVKSFNSSEIDYMFTGALAASYYGTPRTTVDVDIVAQVSKENADRLIETLRKAQVEASKRKVEQAIDSDFRMLTVIDRKTALHLDIILSNKKLKKKPGKIVSLPTFYQTPEELILAKLRMVKVTIPPERALKDKDDIRAVLRHARINIKTIEKQAEKENTLYLFKELQKERTKQ
jgi:hypothetical protein